MKIVKTKKGELEAIKSARQAPESKPRRVSRSRLNSHKKHYSSEVRIIIFKLLHLHLLKPSEFHSSVTPIFYNSRLPIYNMRIVKVKKAQRKNMTKKIPWQYCTVMYATIKLELLQNPFYNCLLSENIQTTI